MKSTDLVSALAASTDEPHIHAVLTELFDKALHNHSIDQTNIDAVFFIDQHGFVAFGLLHNQQFMHFYGHSNDWLRLTVDDLRALLVRGPNSRMNAKDLYDDRFMVRFMIASWLSNQVRMAIVFARRLMDPELRMPE